MFESQARPPFGNKIFGRRTLLLWIIIGTLLFLSILAGSALFFSQSKSTQSPAPSKGGGGKLPEGGTTSGGNVPPDSNSSANISLTPKAAIFLSNQEIAGKILAWLDKTRVFGKKLDNPSKAGEFLSDGGYAKGEYCDIQNNCDPFMTANNIGLVATWANFKYYEKYRDQAFFEVVKKDLATYSDSKKIAAIQPAFWNLKLMYELWKSPLIPQKQKDQIAVIIYRMQHNPTVVKSAEARAKSHTVKTLNIEQYLTQHITEKVTIPENPDDYAIVSSEYASAALYMKDSNLGDAKVYYDTALDLFNNAFKIYASNRLVIDPYLLAVAALDLYKYDANKQYLNLAALVVKDNSNECSNLTVCAYRIYLLTELKKLQPDTNYESMIEAAIKYLYANNYDYQGLESFKLGKGIYYSMDKTVSRDLRYDLIPNALIVGVISAQ